MKKLAAVFLLVCMVFALAACGGKTPSGGSGSGGKSEVIVPDKFSFEGGTGKVSISCSGITYEDGAPYATIEFGSDSYSYIKIGGVQYDCEHGEGTSFASIPITLNENNTILAETTRMSEAHEIEYQIFVYVSDGNGDPYSLLRSPGLDEEALFIPGIASVAKDPVVSSDICRLFTYQDGIYLLELKVSDAAGPAAVSDPKTYVTKAMTTEAAQENLYKNSVVKYLLAPVDAELPAGIEKEAIVIRIPAANAYVGDGSIELKDIVTEGYDLLMLTDRADGTTSFEELASDAANLHIPLIVNPKVDTVPQILLGDAYNTFFAEK